MSFQSPHHQPPQVNELASTPQVTGLVLSGHLTYDQSPQVCSLFSSKYIVNLLWSLESLVISYLIVLIFVGHFTGLPSLLEWPPLCSGHWTVELDSRSLDSNQSFPVPGHTSNLLRKLNSSPLMSLDSTVHSRHWTHHQPSKSTNSTHATGNTIGLVGS